MSDVTDTFYPGGAIHGYGSQILCDSEQDGIFRAFADITSITPGDMTTEVFDKTHLRSPEAHREKKAGIRDSGPFALAGNWRPTHGSHSNVGGDGFVSGGLVSLWRRRVERDFKIVVPVEEAGTAPVAVSTVTSAAGVATVTTAAPHGLTSGLMVLMAGATPAEYNGSKVITVVSPTTFTYPVEVGTATPATGTITGLALGTMALPFRGVVTKYQPGEIGIEDKIPFTGEITPLQDFSANLY